MIAQAGQTAVSSQPAPGFFLLAWGLVASVMGLGLVTNYRGFADKFAQHAYVSSSWARRVPPWKRIPEEPGKTAGRVKMLRFIGIPFAVAGPVVTIAGVVQIAHGHIAIPRGPVLPLPFALAFIGVAAVTMGQLWRRGGICREAARQGGWMRAAAIVASAGAAAFGVFIVIGQTTLAIAGWLVGGLASAPLLMSRKPDAPG